MKNFFKILLLFLLTGYLIFAFIRMGNEEDCSVCSEFDIVIADTAQTGLITPAEVERLLKRAHLYPVGQPMDSISGSDIENLLKENPFVKEATFYKSHGGKSNVIIQQHLPVMRIMPETGNSYYIDELGRKLEPLNYNIDLPVATGKIDTAFTKNHLVRLAYFLEVNPFWNDQITQINVNENKEIDLVTRVGSNLLIHLGTTDSIPQKFNKLKAFYDKVLPEVGWNTYQSINLEYNNQIVCKRR